MGIHYDCVEIYGYEEPIPSTTHHGRSFADVCEKVSRFEAHLRVYDNGYE